MVLDVPDGQSGCRCPRSDPYAVIPYFVCFACFAAGSSVRVTQVMCIEAVVALKVATSYAEYVRVSTIQRKRDIVTMVANARERYDA